MLRNGLPANKESGLVESRFRLPYQFADSLQFVSVTNGENGNLETVIAAHTDADMTDAKCDITFTNYYKPIKKTSESTTETIPTTKRKPETKPGNKTSIKKSKNKVKTGDNSNATLFAILLLVSGTGLLIIAISRYREKYHK